MANYIFWQILIIIYAFQYLKLQVLSFCWILNFQQVGLRRYAIFQTVLYSDEVYARSETNLSYTIP